MNRRLIAPVVALLMVACAAPPTREDESAFKLLSEGTIPKERVLDFNACLLDGFGKAHFVLTSWTVRQQVRPEGYRVETLAGSGPLITVSADILHTGAVRLYEANSAALINTSGQREAFSSCLQRVGGKLA
jgi:hypothetical protein